MLITSRKLYNSFADTIDEIHWHKSRTSISTGSSLDFCMGACYRPQLLFSLPQIKNLWKPWRLTTSKICIALTFRSPSLPPLLPPSHLFSPVLTMCSPSPRLSLLSPSLGEPLMAGGSFPAGRMRLLDPVSNMGPEAPCPLFTVAG